MTLPVELKFLETVSLGEVVLYVIVVTAVVQYIRKGLPFTRKVFRLLDIWFGDPRAGKPGLIERMEVLEQLKNNGGSSMKDKVDQIPEMAHTINRMQSTLEQHLITSNQFMAADVLDRQQLHDRVRALERNQHEV